MIARARKNTPVTPVVAISGTNTTIGVMVEKTNGVVISLQGAADCVQPALSRVAMQRDVFDHDDCVINDQSHRGGQSAQASSD